MSKTKPLHVHHSHLLVNFFTVAVWLQCETSWSDISWRPDLNRKQRKSVFFIENLGADPSKFIRRKFSPSARQFHSSRWNLKQLLTIRVMFSLPPPWLCRVFLHDVTAAILVSQNNETAAMLVSQTNPPHLHKCWPREWKRCISHLLVNQSELEVAVTSSC